MQSVNTYIIISIVSFQTCEISLIGLDVSGGGKKKKRGTLVDFNDARNRRKAYVPASAGPLVVIC